jgi:hypothetical protein
MGMVQGRLRPKRPRVPAGRRRYNRFMVQQQYQQQQHKQFPPQMGGA